MLRITIMLEPHGKAATARLLGEGTIANTAEGTETSGAYLVNLLKSPEYAVKGNVGKLWRAGRVTRFPRKKLGPWDLLLRALLAAVGDRNIDAITEAQARLCQRITGPAKPPINVAGAAPGAQG